MGMPRSNRNYDNKEKQFSKWSKKTITRNPYQKFNQSQNRKCNKNTIPQIERERSNNITSNSQNSKEYNQR